MNDYFAAKMAKIAQRRQMTQNTGEINSGEINGNEKELVEKDEEEGEEIKFETFKENLYKIQNPFKGSNLFDIVGYTPYTVFQSLDMLLEDKERRALKKGKIMARKIRSDPNYYLNLKKPTVPSLENAHFKNLTRFVVKLYKVVSQIFSLGDNFLQLHYFCGEKTPYFSD